MSTDQTDFETWRDEQLATLRWQFRQRTAWMPYQSFPDFCRAVWDREEQEKHFAA